EVLDTTSRARVGRIPLAIEPEPTLLEVTPDWERVFLATWKKPRFVWQDLRSTAPPSIVESVQDGKDGVRKIVCSGDGSHVLVATLREVVRFRIGAGGLEKEGAVAAGDGGGGEDALAASSDLAVLLAPFERTVSVFGAKGHRELARPAAYVLALSPDGSVAVVHHFRDVSPSIQCLATATGDVLGTLDLLPGTDKPVHIAFAPDGERFYVGTALGLVHVVELR
ncbi:MAG: hypothetical protein ACAI25_19015, partial [Planctomycetota bacterium]